MGIQSSKLLALLSAAEAERLSPFLHEVQLGRGQGLLEAGSLIDYVWFPHDCVTSTVVDSAEGPTIEVGLMGYEGMVGLSLALGKAVSNTTVIVQIPGTATKMAAHDFTRHVVHERSELFSLLLQYTDSFMAMVAQTAACNSLHAIDERLARWILMVHDRIGRNDIALTQEFLAFMLGVRRPSVSLAASDLQQRGLIRYGRGQINVIDRKGLERCACDCYNIVRDIMSGMFPMGGAMREEGA